MVAVSSVKVDIILFGTILKLVWLKPSLVIPRSLRNSLERSVEDCQFLKSRESNSLPGGHLLLAAQLLNGPNLLVPIMAGGS